MTGSNLPPGCSVRDIPGNRPEDQKAEALMDQIYDILDPILEATKDETSDAIAEKLFQLCGAIYQEGYNEGQRDEALAHSRDDAGESL